MAKRQVFFSFHYEEDVWRAAKVRNMGEIEGTPIFSDNGWEKVRRTSETAIKSWINNEMEKRSCIVVLIGEHTYSRKWVLYEIEQAWRKGKGIVGIYIDKIEDNLGKQSSKGKNPFDLFFVSSKANSIGRFMFPACQAIKLSAVCKTFDSAYYTSKYVYDDIKNNIGRLIEEAIEIRNRYPK